MGGNSPAHTGVGNIDQGQGQFSEGSGTTGGAWRWLGRKQSKPWPGGLKACAGADLRLGDRNLVEYSYCITNSVLEQNNFH